MSPRPWIALAIAFAATVARAEDPPSPPAKHENRISPGAKAAMDRFRALVNRPEDQALTSVRGAFVPMGIKPRDRRHPKRRPK